MGVPDTFIFTIKDVCTELQITGASTASLDDMMNGSCGAPKVTYDPTYGGAYTCMRNFRNYCLTGTTGDMTSYGGPGQSASDGTNMWFAHFSTASVTKVSTGGTILNNYTGLGAGTRGIAFDGTNMWTANRNGNNVSKITPAGVVTNYSVGATSYPVGIAYDGTNMWSVGACISKITPAGSVTTWSHSGAISRSIAYDGTNMWLSDNCNAGGVYKVTSTGTKTYYAFDYTPQSGARSAYGLAFDGTNMWTGANGAFGLVKINVSTGVRTYYDYLTLDVKPTSVNFDGTYLWAADDCNVQGRIGKYNLNGEHLITYHGAGIRYNCSTFAGGKIWASDGINICVGTYGAC